MAIKDALQKATIRLVGQKPTTFIGATGRLEMELCDLIDEVATDVFKYRDWQALIRIAEIDGDGSETEFALPADYDRMLVRSDVQDTVNWAWGYSQFFDINEFLFEEARGFMASPGGWIIYGDRIRFSPSPISGAHATYPYLSKFWAKTSGAASGDKAAFTADTDEFVLPERLLTLGLVWRWRENKKLDASGDQEAFVKALDEYAAKDRGSRIIRSNSRRRYPGTHLAWPGELG